MTREEGIIQTHKSKMTTTSFPDWEIKQVVDTEYKNYTELCEFCGEKPMPKDTWLSQLIEPKNV